MSKVGKKTIEIPKGVEIKVDGSLIKVKGPKGEMQLSMHESMETVLSEDEIAIAPKEAFVSAKSTGAMWGLTRSLVANMIEGVSNGFEKSLEFSGVGYKANVNGDKLELHLGYSHPITIKAPGGITFTVEKNNIKVSGIDKELVGHVAAEIKSKRLPEPYKGSGIKYAGEVILRKTGKKAATAG